MYTLFTVASIVIFAQASDSKNQDETIIAEQQKKWDEFYRKEAASYSITLERAEATPLKFQPQPVLLWSNPVRGNDTKGSVFVWTHEGRAEVVGTVFSYRKGDDYRQVKHSFHSLSLGPITGERNGKVEWSMTVPGIKPKRIPDAPVPAKTRALRLTQMRDLAREFSANTTINGVDQELRLLPQPLFRYEGSSADVIDGALFTFVIGTDPELMLVIESKGPEDNPVWHFGAGRFTDLALTLRRNETVLWRYEDGLDDNETTPYVSRMIEVRSKTLP